MTQSLPCHLQIHWVSRGKLPPASGLQHGAGYWAFRTVQLWRLFIWCLLTQHLFCVKGLGRQQTDRQKWSLSSWSFHLGMRVGLGEQWKNRQVRSAAERCDVFWSWQSRKVREWCGWTEWMTLDRVTSSLSRGSLSVSPLRGCWEWGSHTGGSSRSRGL